MQLNNGTFLLWLAPASSSNSPGCSCTTFQALQALPLQSMTVLIPGLPSKLWVLAPNPALTSGHMAQAGMHRIVAPTIFAGFSLSCLPQTSCCTLLFSLWSSFSVPGDLPPGEDASQGAGTLLPFQLPLSNTGLILLPLLFFLPYWFHGDLSCSFRCLRSSAGEHQFISRCSVRIVPFVNIFVGGVSATFSYSAILILPLKDFFNIQKIYCSISFWPYTYLS